VPLALPSASLVVASTFTLASSPAGLQVCIAAADAGVTPVSTTPPISNAPVSLSILPTNGKPAYTYVADQTENGNHAIYYNQAADTTGSLGTIQAASLARASLAGVSGASAVRRRPRSFGAGRQTVNPDAIVVRYRAAALRTSGRSALAIERSAGVATGTALGIERDGLVTRTLRVPAGQTASELIARMRAQSEVASAGPVYRRYTSTVAPTSVDDPYFLPVQWDLTQIKAPYAWSYTAGSPAITIAIVDTGVDRNNPEISGKLVSGESILGGTVTPGLAAAQDNDGHGTNVAGIAAAATNNTLGFAGAGYNVKLRIYKVFPDPVPPSYDKNPSYGANDTDIAQALYDAVANGANVVNLSLGGCQADGVGSVERDAVEYAIAHNVTVVAAAGNDRSGGTCSGGGQTLEYPAAYDGVISVGASALDDAAPYDAVHPKEYVASYSNSAPNLTVVAPGGDATSTTDGDVLHWITNISTATAADPAFACTGTDVPLCPLSFEGTSQATPHVAGVAALMLSKNPALTPGQIAQIVANTADDLGDPYQGHGRLNAYRALAAVAGDPAPPAAPSATNFIAIAYTNSGGTKPAIANVTYPGGVRVAANGSFRIADVPQTLGTYKIGLWYDANGNGSVDAGDWFGASRACTSTSSCTANASGIAVRTVVAGFTLP
jgi:subtilisin family serine protease